MTVQSLSDTSTGFMSVLFIDDSSPCGRPTPLHSFHPVESHETTSFVYTLDTRDPYSDDVSPEPLQGGV